MALNTGLHRFFPVLHSLMGLAWQSTGNNLNFEIRKKIHMESPNSQILLGSGIVLKSTLQRD